MTLPFLDAEHDININLCIVLLIISVLGRTARGSLKINNERLHVFLYLVKNPTSLNKFMGALGKDAMPLRDYEINSIATISPNMEPLFDRYALKALLSILASKNFLSVEYKKDEGFFYTVSETGSEAVDKLRDNYFVEIKSLCGSLKSVLSVSESALNQTLNQIIRKESM